MTNNALLTLVAVLVFSFLMSIVITTHRTSMACIEAGVLVNKTECIFGVGR